MARRFVLLFGVGILLGFAGRDSAQAADLFADVKQIITDYGCGACHSTDGSILVPGVPRIAGQKRDYLYRQLRHFRKGTVTYKGEVVAARHHSVMNDLANWLSNAQLKNIAEFYASRPCGKALTALPAKPPGVERCEVCHGGERTNPWADTPYLGAQDETYLKRTIHSLWQSRVSHDVTDERYNRLAEVMFVDADRPHLDDYAAYYARLPCKEPGPAPKQ